ncbi:thioredoxin family protein [bacterium]|nr:thioredoxin family protein [bacterium]
MSNEEAKKKMMPLQDQEMLEQLLQRGEYKNAQVYPNVVIYFTADWCGACKRIDLSHLINSLEGVRWYICDVDQNNYSAGFAGVKTIPSFLPIKNGKHQPLISTNVTDHVLYNLYQSLYAQ